MEYDNNKLMYVDCRVWSVILKESKPSVWLLHGYYPGGRNDPNNKKPA